MSCLKEFIQSNISGDCKDDQTNTTIRLGELERKIAQLEAEIEKLKLLVTRSMSHPWTGFSYTEKYAWIGGGEAGDRELVGRSADTMLPYDMKCYKITGQASVFDQYSEHGTHICIDISGNQYIYALNLNSNAAMGGTSPVTNFSIDIPAGISMSGMTNISVYGVRQISPVNTTMVKGAIMFYNLCFSVGSV